MLYNPNMSNRKNIKHEKPYRPLKGMPYKRVALSIAKEINKTSPETFDDLDVQRLADFELWKRVFPGVPFPRDADVLRRRYDIDPGVKNVQSA